MALAIVSYDGEQQGQLQFEAQLGRNRYFQYRVGTEPRRDRLGLQQLEDTTLESRVLGPVPEHRLGRIRFRIDRQAIQQGVGERLNRPQFIQLKSFRDAQGNGPAMSETVIIPPVMLQSDHDPMAFSHDGSRGRAMTQIQQTTQGDTVRVKAFNYRQARYSNAMFLQALIPAITSALPAIGSAVSGALPAVTNALPQMLPHLAPLLGGLLDSLGSQSNNAQLRRVGRTAENVLGEVGTQENARHLAALLQQLNQLQQQGQNNATQTNGSGTANPQATAQSVAPAYATAQVAPLVAALPALMPLLQQVLTPETMQGIINMPNQHMQTIINGIKDVSQLAIQSHEQDLRHLREIHPDMEDPELHQLLMTMSLNLNSAPSLNYRRVPSVECHLKTQLVNIGGSPTVLFSQQAPTWRIPFDVSTPHRIREARVHLLIKDKSSLRTMLHRQFDVGDVDSGQQIDVIELSADELARFKASTAYLFCIHLVWRNRSGEKRGTSRQAEVTVTSGAVFDRIDEGGDLIPLKDPQKFADHWHKIWQDRFTREVSQHVIEARYYLRFEAVEQRLARFETQGRFKTENRQKHGQLRTGVEWTLDTIESLRRQLLPQTPALTDIQKQALHTEAFQRRFGTVAHKRVDLRGRYGKLAELWVYPVVKLQSLILLTPAATDVNGQVTKLQETQVPVPIPVQVHYVGFKS